MLVGLVLAAMLLTVPLVQAHSPSRDQLFDFSIPPQPLAAALSRYGDVTGSEALYEGHLSDELVSSGVKGRLTATDALSKLLEGTGVASRFIAEGTFVLVPATQPREQREKPPSHERYYALLQQAVLGALCGLQEGRPGDYRMVVTFWIGPSGAVDDVLRIGTAGGPTADNQIDRTLRALKFSEGPPRDFLQPVRLLFVPEAPGARSGCETLNARAGAARRSQ